MTPGAKVMASGIGPDCATASGVFRVQERQLLRAPHDACGCKADQLSERAGEMRLVEVTRLVCGLEDRHPASQEARRVPCPLDLAQRAERHPGCVEEMTLRRTLRERLRVA